MSAPTRISGVGLRAVEALASLRLAVLLMVSLAVACTVATFYESTHGTAAAQREFYGTGWFSLLLALLGANIFASMMKRYPWRAQHVGFVTAHVGIVVLLLGSLASLHLGLDSSMALYEGETTDRVSLLGKALQVALPDHAAHGSFDVDFDRRPPGPGREQRFPVPGTDVTLVAEDYLFHARVAEEIVEAAEGPPALHVHLSSSFANQEAWLVEGDAESSHLNLGAVVLMLHASSEPAEARGDSHAANGANVVSFAVAPDGALSYALSTSRGPGPRGRVVVDKPIETPWMGMTATVTRFLPRSRVERTVSAEAPPDRDARRLPAVKVRLEQAEGRSASQWLLWTESRALPFPGGAARVAYRSPEVAVPFRVSLLKFRSEKYPGSSMAASYESWVRVEDPERGVSEHHISMNNPLHYRGYIFFQASFVEGEPMMSIFSVTRAPGLPLVYLGVALISAGVLWMFYLKPYLARRQAARALRARGHDAPGVMKPCSP